jgi:hypothetical protein
MTIRQLALAGLAALCLSSAACGGSSSSSVSSGTSSVSGGTSSSPSSAHPAGASVPRSWPAPSNPLQLVVAAGLKPEPFETLIHHVHAHLDVFVNGAHVRVPAGIGINIHDPGVHNAPLPDGTTGYGGIQRCASPCISPLHTHDDTGILHTESSSPVPNRLGQFFIEWGVRLTPQCVGGSCRPATSINVFVNGRPFSGDPSTIQLTNGEEIALVIGTPPKTIPSTANLSQA